MVDVTNIERCYDYVDDYGGIADDTDDYADVGYDTARRYQGNSGDGGDDADADYGDGETDDEW